MNMLHEEMEVNKREKNRQKVQNFRQKKQESDTSFKEKESIGRQRQREQEMANNSNAFRERSSWPPKSKGAGDGK